MANRKSNVTMRNYGIYSHWDSKTKELPKIIEYTTRICARIDVEFGFVVNIQGAKNRQLDFRIDHPGILDDAGNRRDPFEGTVYVKTNDWNFYLGDTIWEPIDDKLGDWRMTLEMDGKIVAEKTFELHVDEL